MRIVSVVTANKRVDDPNANLNKRIDDLRTLSIAILSSCVLGVVAHIVKAFFLNQSLEAHLSLRAVCIPHPHRTLPPYAVFLIVIGAIGGAVPLLHIYATTHLIDMLMAERARADASSIDLLMPYAPYLGLLIGMMALHWILYYDTFQRYLPRISTSALFNGLTKPFFGACSPFPSNDSNIPNSTTP